MCGRNADNCRIVRGWSHAFPRWERGTSNALREDVSIKPLTMQINPVSITVFIASGILAYSIALLLLLWGESPLHGADSLFPPKPVEGGTKASARNHKNKAPYGVAEPYITGLAREAATPAMDQ